MLLAAVAVMAHADPPQNPPPGMGKYYMFIRKSAPAPKGQKPKKYEAPDVKKFGGQEVQVRSDYRVVFLPPAAVRQLRENENVDYIQRVWMGESIEEWGETESAGDGLKTLSDTEGPTWGPKNYSYDKSGNITAIGSDTYWYDAVSRIAQAVTNNVTQTYSYDAFGNIMTIQTGTEAATFPVESSTNRLLNQTYDLAGNVISDAEGGDYYYDSVGMMSGIAAGTSQARRYYYTADDERIGFTMGETFGRWYIRDFGGRVLREFRTDAYLGGFTNANWIWTEDFVYGAGQLVGAETAGPFGSDQATVAAGRRRRHFHVDHLGSTRVITTDSRESLGVHNYYPFGKEQSQFFQEEANFGGGGYIRPEPMRFTGHERDFLGYWNVENDDQLDYMHARYYNPHTGRFLSVDPGRDWNTKQPQSWNMYSYVQNNPINATDPTGKWIEIQKKNDSAAVREFLIRTVMRPTGRTLIQSIGQSPIFGVTIADHRINPPVYVSKGQMPPGQKFIGGTFSPNWIEDSAGKTIGASGGTMLLDTAALGKIHPDRSGVTTTAHEFLHATGAEQGLNSTELKAQDTSGAADAFGRKVSQETPDIGRKEAEVIVDDLLSGDYKPKP